jgi:hypothetical protein
VKLFQSLQLAFDEPAERSCCLPFFSRLDKRIEAFDVLALVAKEARSDVVERISNDMNHTWNALQRKVFNCLVANLKKRAFVSNEGS